MDFGLFVWRMKNKYRWLGDTLVRNEINKVAQGKVVSGMFAGMQYLTNSVGSLLYPRILGTYEKELFSVFEAVNRAGYQLIVDIGAAEGYYAVGLAQKNKQSNVIAFESVESGRKLISDMAKLNGVENQIEVKGFCNHSQLNLALENQKKVFVLVDIEGGEESLLDPVEVPELENVVMLVEVHDCFSETVGEVLLKRFAATHIIDEIWEQKRSINDFPIALGGLKKQLLHNAILRSMAEYRGKRMRWFYMIPKKTSQNE